MPKYDITLTKTLTRGLTLTAPSEQEALQKIAKTYQDYPFDDGTYYDITVQIDEPSSKTSKMLLEMGTEG